MRCSVLSPSAMTTPLPHTHIHRFLVQHKLTLEALEGAGESVVKAANPLGDRVSWDYSLFK